VISVGSVAKLFRNPQSAIEKFITNNRMRIAVSSENLNKTTLHDPGRLRQSDVVKAAVRQQDNLSHEGPRLSVA
jgi:hypothetical protein